MDVLSKLGMTVQTWRHLEQAWITTAFYTRVFCDRAGPRVTRRCAGPPGTRFASWASDSSSELDCSRELWAPMALYGWYEVDRLRWLDSDGNALTFAAVGLFSYFLMPVLKEVLAGSNTLIDRDEPR